MLYRTLKQKSSLPDSIQAPREKKRWQLERYSSGETVLADLMNYLGEVKAVIAAALAVCPLPLRLRRRDFPA